MQIFSSVCRVIVVFFHRNGEYIEHSFQELLHTAARTGCDVLGVEYVHYVALNPANARAIASPADLEQIVEATGKLALDFVNDYYRSTEIFLSGFSIVTAVMNSTSKVTPSSFR